MLSITTLNNLLLSCLRKEETMICFHTAGLDNERLLTHLKRDVVYHLGRWLEYIFRRLLLHETFDLRRYHALLLLVLGHCGLSSPSQNYCAIVE